MTGAASDSANDMERHCNAASRREIAGCPTCCVRFKRAASSKVGQRAADLFLQIHRLVARQRRQRRLRFGNAVAQ